MPIPDFPEGEAPPPVMVLVPLAVVMGMEQEIERLRHKLASVAPRPGTEVPEISMDTQRKATELLARFRLVKGDGFIIKGPLPPQSMTP